MTDKKYMVFVEGGKMPCVAHPSIESAKKEAERHAKENPNKRVLVLQKVSEMRGEVVVREQDYD